MDLSAKLPSSGGQPPLLVVGTLDVNVGAALPSEELVGRLGLVVRVAFMFWDLGI